MGSKFTKNISWIFFGNFAHAVLQFLLNIVCARSFGTENFGLINYGSSLIAFFTAIATLGFYGVVTKFFAMHPDKAGDYIGTSIIFRFVVSSVSVVVLQIIVCFLDNADSEIRLIVFCQSLQIVFASFDSFVYWYRFKSEAKTVAIFRLVAFFISAAWKLVAILVFHNVVLYVIGVSLETGLFVLFQFIQYKKRYSKFKLRFSTSVLKKMLRISYPFIISSILVTVYAQTDKIMLKGMVSVSAVGLYSVSLTLAAVISIVPQALIEGFRPDIMTYKLSSPEKYRQRMQQLYGSVFWICVAYCIFMTLLAKPIIMILYGEQYLGAVPSLSIVVWYVTFSYFGSINNVYMVAEDKTKWVQISAFAGALINILLNALLIPRWDIVGAATASLITQLLANFVMLIIIPSLRDAAKMMIEGILLKGFKGVSVKAVLKGLIKR